ncbi:hydroxymethylbilane synthase [Pelagibius litoralis]|uniref:Porphobilinogen deaminase n=1 Tax=Pelagibius litoralis TaxID=374515 RepID=A0A967F145_9PROT|nr:hydroxymethylbilane synthase [Pelagibius litoralis]NIA71046.1 hydroxymethylbilane synthase [Pelagibius litoralis]
MTDKPQFRLGTRGSPLALAQAREVCERLGKAHPALAEADAVEIVVIKTTGDLVQDRALSEIGGKGLFTKEIEEALLDGRIDAAVHSMKDVPTWLPDGLVVDHVLPREDPRDAYFSPHGNSLADLPEGAVVGTSSLRRQAQVLIARPDLKVEPIRGNVDTRLRKLAEGQVDATLLAVAGLRRLGQADKITAAIPTEEMLPAVAQGAVGLETRADDNRSREILDAIACTESGLRVAAERALLAVLEGSCRTPIAGLAELGGGGSLRVRGLVAMPDGSEVYRADLQGSVSDPTGLGEAVGSELRAAGGSDFFDAITGH